MNKQDIIRKLTSRKFFALVAEFVSMLIIAMGAAENTAVQVSAIIMGGGAVIAYIFGEAMADAAGAKAADIPDVGFIGTLPEETKPPQQEDQ